MYKTMCKYKAQIYSYSDCSETFLLILPFPPPGDLPHPEIQAVPLTPPALAGGFFTTRTTCEAYYKVYLVFNNNSGLPLASLVAQ